MCNRPRPAPRLTARSTVVTALLGAAFVYWTRAWAVPVGVPILIAAIALALVAHERFQRHLAQVHASEQQRRADVLADPRTPTAVDLLHAGPRDQLIGHDDRAFVLDRLGERYATGHLTADEHEARATEAVQARTRGQLAQVLRDLP